MPETKTRIDRTDEGKPTDFTIYLYEEEIDGQMYGGSIVARSIEGAKRKAESFGAKIIGRAIEEMDVQRSEGGICGGDISKDLTNVEPIQDEWAEEFE